MRSRLHFEGKSGKFIPLEVRARDVKRKLLASAWDLFLLRLPETLIVNEGNDYTSICYVCTAEKVLQRLGRMFVVRRVASFKEGRGSVPSSVSFREDLLKDEIGEELTARFFALYQQGATGPSCRTPKTLEEISSLVEALEHKSSEIAAI